MIDIMESTDYQTKCVAINIFKNQKENMNTIKVKMAIYLKM
jgi:hypothetical protein